MQADTANMRGVLIHIPKTGGTSTREMFRNLVGDYVHMTGQQIRHSLTASGQMSQARWDGLFKFSVVRNPWQRFLSRYLSKNRTHILRTSRDGFRSWLKGASDSMDAKSPRNMFKGIELDYVGRFEHFDANTAAIAAGLGVQVPAMLHRNNRMLTLETLVAGQPESERTGQFRNIVSELSQWREHLSTRYVGGDWRPYYDAASHDAVAEFGAWEIERFGYAFDDCAVVAA